MKILILLTMIGSTFGSLKCLAQPRYGFEPLNRLERLETALVRIQRIDKGQLSARNRAQLQLAERELSNGIKIGVHLFHEAFVDVGLRLTKGVAEATGYGRDDMRMCDTARVRAVYAATVICHQSNQYCGGRSQSYFDESSNDPHYYDKTVVLEQSVGRCVVLAFVLASEKQSPSWGFWKKKK